MTIELGQWVEFGDDASPPMRVDQLLDGDRVSVVWFVRGKLERANLAAAGLLPARGPRPTPSAEELADQLVAALKKAESERLASPPETLLITGPAAEPAQADAPPSEAEAG